MLMLKKETFVEMVRNTKKYFDMGIEIEYRLAVALDTDPVKITHPLVTISMFMKVMLEAMFSDEIIGNWICGDITLDEKGGVELTIEYNCGQTKTFYIKDEADIYDYLIWKSRQKRSIHCCVKTERE